MNKFMKVLVVILTTLFANTALAFTPPAPNGFVTDTMGVLNPGQVSSLSSKISHLNDSTHNEIGVLIIPSVGDESIEDVTHDTFKAWRVGKAGLDNGVLVVIAVNSHKLRIQTGKGVEGDLPDLVCNDIINKMKPSLKKNDFNGALNIAVDNISARLESRRGQQADPGAGAKFNQPLPESNVTPTPTTTNHSSCQVAAAGLPGGNMIWFLLLVGIVGLIWFVRNRSKAESKRLEDEAEARRERLARDAAEAKARDEEQFRLARQKRAQELELSKHVVESQPAKAQTPEYPPASPVQGTVEELKAKLERERAENKGNYTIPTAPAIPRPRKTYNRAQPHTPSPAAVATAGAAAAAAATLAAVEAERVARQRREQQEREENERAAARREEEARARRRREQEEEDDRRRRDSSSSSSSSYDSGSSSWGGGDSGGGFGGGDSGGGGSSGDW